MDDELSRYVEEVALFFEEQGLPRIAGRILGLLLVCEPPHRSAAELVDEVGASKASISTMTRMLLETGLVERAVVPGERATFYRLHTDGFERRFEIVMRALVGFRPIADRGLALLDGQPSERATRLRELRALYLFLEDEMRGVFDRWRAQRAQLIAEDP